MSDLSNELWRSFPNAPWCWYIYIHLGEFLGQMSINAPDMEHMEFLNWVKLEDHYRKFQYTKTSFKGSTGTGNLCGTNATVFYGHWSSMPLESLHHGFMNPKSLERFFHVLPILQELERYPCHSPTHLTHHHDTYRHLHGTWGLP